MERWDKIPVDLVADRVGSHEGILLMIVPAEQFTAVLQLLVSTARAAQLTLGGKTIYYSKDRISRQFLLECIAQQA